MDYAYFHQKNEIHLIDKLPIGTTSKGRGSIHSKKNHLDNILTIIDEMKMENPIK